MSEGRGGPPDRALDRRLARLREEVEDELSPLTLDGDFGQRLLEEIHYARFPRVHEGHAPIYGALVFRGAPAHPVTGPQEARVVELAGLPLALARDFADGRGAFLMRSSDPDLSVACFEHSIEYEANLVDLVRTTGAHVVQRTLRGHVRLFTPRSVVTWDGVRWLQKPHATHLRRIVLRLVPSCDEEVLDGLLALTLHWLSPSFRGATLVWSLHRPISELSGIDVRAGFWKPELEVTRREQYWSLFSVHAQTDGATLVEPDGTCAAYGITLLPSVDAERTVPAGSGTRHTSARRFTFDHPGTVAFVVSEDWSVSVYVDGAEVALARDAGAWSAHPDPVGDGERPERLVRCSNCGRRILLDLPLAGGAGRGEATVPCPVCEVPVGPVTAGAVSRGVSTPEDQRRADRHR